jgi:hypothetical protein
MIHTWMDVVPYARLRSIGHALVNALGPNDQGAIGSFSQEVAISPFITSDHRPLHRVVDEELWGGNGNPLGSAVYLAASGISTARPRRGGYRCRNTRSAVLFRPSWQLRCS